MIESARQWKLVVLPLSLTTAIMVTLAIADDKPESEESPTPVVGQMPPAANDSIFAIISQGFERFKPTFVRSCFDCHSDQTSYPWYYKLPVIKGMIDHDIEEGREHVDFSRGFPFTGKGSQADMLTEIRDEISGGTMPIRPYRITHWGRLIESPFQDTLFAWIDSSLVRLEGVGIATSKKQKSGDQSEKE